MMRNPLTWIAIALGVLLTLSAMLGIVIFKPGISVSPEGQGTETQGPAPTSVQQAIVNLNKNQSTLDKSFKNLAKGWQDLSGEVHEVQGEVASLKIEVAILSKKIDKHFSGEPPTTPSPGFSDPGSSPGLSGSASEWLPAPPFLTGKKVHDFSTAEAYRKKSEDWYRSLYPDHKVSLVWKDYPAYPNPSSSTKGKRLFAPDPYRCWAEVAFAVPSLLEEEEILMSFIRKGSFGYTAQVVHWPRRVAASPPEVAKTPL